MGFVNIQVFSTLNTKNKKTRQKKSLKNGKNSLKNNLEIASRVVYLEGKCFESLIGADYAPQETPFLFQLEKTN